MKSSTITEKLETEVLKIITIATHDGKFHADEVFACWVIDRIAKLAGGAVRILRTRNPEIYNSDDVDLVIDVGGKFDGDVLFDHHQRDFSEFRENGAKYASAGLVWRQFGHQLLTLAGVDNINRLHKSIDDTIISGIDQTDNGVVEVTDHMTLSRMISNMNPSWDQNLPAEGVLEIFYECIDLIDTIMSSVIDRCISSERAESIVTDTIAQSETPEVIIFDRFVPMDRLIIEDFPKVQFVVYPDISSGWRVKTIPSELGSFTPRRQLPESWAGLRGTELQQVAKVEDAMFCHNGRFIAGADSREGAILMATHAMVD